MPIKRKRKGTHTGHNTRNTLFEDGSRSDSKPRKSTLGKKGISDSQETRTAVFEDGSSKNKNRRKKFRALRRRGGR